MEKPTAINLMVLDSLKHPIFLVIEFLFLVMIPMVILITQPELLEFRLAYLILILIYTLAISKVAGFTSNQFGLSFRFLVKSLKSLFLPTVSLIIFIIAGFLIVPELFIVREMNKLTLGYGILPDLIIYILISVTIQELVFRGYLINRLRLIIPNSKFVIIFSALVYSIAHSAHDNTVMLTSFTFLLGVIYAREFIKNHCIYAIMISHGVIGGAALLCMHILF